MSRTPATDCDHPVVRTMFFEDARNALWHCSTCDLRFYPACRTCVDVGHRNVEHPAQARTAVPEIDGLRALSEAATPGTWRRDTGVHDNVVRAEGDFEWVGVSGWRHDMPDPVFSGQVSNRGGQHVADAAFIAAAVNYVRAALAAKPEPGHPDAGNPERNHYDWFMPENVSGHVDSYLDDLEAKLTESLVDPFVHDMADSVLPLIVAYREARAALAAKPEPGLDVERLARAYWDSTFQAKEGRVPMFTDTEPENQATYVRRAARIAAEYAATAPQEPEQ